MKYRQISIKSVMCSHLCVLTKIMKLQLKNNIVFRLATSLPDYNNVVASNCNNQTAL